MFKSARWKSEKNKFKVSFKLQFHAAQVPVVVDDALLISVVPADAGKPTVKSDKAAVRDGSCFWENPVYETVKFNREPKSGKIHERIYYFVVGTGSSKAGVIGEASIDFSNYAEATKVCLVSLPLKNSKTEAVLHVSIQRINESIDLREVDETDNAKWSYSLMSQLSNDDIDGTIKSDSVEDVQLTKSISNNSELIVARRGSSGSDITMLSSGSSSGIEIPWLGNSALVDDSLSTPRETFEKLILEEDMTEKLKGEVAALSRQAEMSELELQTLRKQIVKENKKGQDLFKEVVCLKEDREGLKLECEKLRVKSKTNLEGDSYVIVEELREELNHEKELNTNLRIQLQKTQESNSELLLAVRNLDEMLEHKNKEILNISSGSGPISGNEDDVSDDDDDDEQKALEELVKEHGDDKEAYLLEQQIMDMRSEIEIYKRDKDELEMLMEQLALDYEIIKQENHEMAYKLEQSEIQEQLKMQYECSSSADELENQIENLEIELKIRSKESADALVRISELEANAQNLQQELEIQSHKFEADCEALMQSKAELEQKVIKGENLENELKIQSNESTNAFIRIRELELHAKSLEKELEKQSLAFEADLEALTRSKVEHEQRAIKAESILRKTRWQNANTAERIQEEFRRISLQMSSAFQANEKLTSKALAEANELRLQKTRLEEMIGKNSEGHESIKAGYEAKLEQLSSEVLSMTNQIEEMQTELEMQIAKNKILSEEMGGKEILIRDLEKTKILVKEMELDVEQGNDERMELKNVADELQKESNKLRCILDEKDSIVGNLKLELDSLRAKYNEVKTYVLEDEMEKERLRKQVFVLKTDLKKKEDECTSMEMKIKDGIVKGTTLDAVGTNSKTSKTLPRCSKGVENLNERINSLEGQIKLKEVSIEASTITFLEKENDLHNKIEDRLEMLNQISARLHKNEAQKEASIAEFKKEIEVLKMKNGSMEIELKEMQERYLAISLKFAEVEGERQTLVMRVRNLKNAKTSSQNALST